MIGCMTQNKDDDHTTIIADDKALFVEMGKKKLGKYVTCCVAVNAYAWLDAFLAV